MKYFTKEKAVLILEDGTYFVGKSIGKKGTTGGEICFNTGMTGYQEIYTDPSYYGQVIVNTTAHIGNYGTRKDEQESMEPKISGLIVNDYSITHSRHLSDQSLQEYLEINNIVGISNIDTRKLVRHIRSKGAMNCLISAEELNPELLKKKLEDVPSMDGLELASVVSSDTPFFVGSKEATTRSPPWILGLKPAFLKISLSVIATCRYFLRKLLLNRWRNGVLMDIFCPTDLAIRHQWTMPLRQRRRFWSQISRPLAFASGIRCWPWLQDYPLLKCIMVIAV
jgi:hypothetical protein